MSRTDGAPQGFTDGAADHVTDGAADQSADGIAGQVGAATPAAVDTGNTAAAADAGGLARASAVMASGTLVSRVLGLVRVLLQAVVLGTVTASANAWTTANTLPNLIYTLLAGGVLNAVLLPQIVRSFSHGDGGRAYVDRLLTLTITVMLAVTVVVTVGAAVLVRMMTSSSQSQAYLDLATAFALICLPQVFFYGLYTVFGQVLNARSRFGAYMWSPVLANVAAIAGMGAFLVIYPRQPRLGQVTPGMIWLLAGSATLGVAAQALSLVIPLWRSGFRFRPRWGFRGVGLRTASRVALWTFAGVVVSQVPYVISQRVMTHASALDVQYASLTSYNYAFLLFVLPHSMITVSVVTALFTRISHAAHQSDLADVRTQIRNGLRLTAVATVPITVGLLVLSTSLTATLLFTNDLHATDGVAYLLIAMSLGLVPYGAIYLIQRVYYAFEDARTPFRLQVVLAVVATLGNGGAILLPGPWITLGVAVSQTVSTTVAALVGFVWLRRLVGRLHLARVVRTYVRLTVAALIAAAGALLIRFAADAMTAGRLSAVLTLAVGGGVFLTLYALLATAMRVGEIEELVGPVLRRARRVLVRG